MSWRPMLSVSARANTPNPGFAHAWAPQRNAHFFSASIRGEEPASATIAFNCGTSAQSKSQPDEPILALAPGQVGFWLQVIFQA